MLARDKHIKHDFQNTIKIRVKLARDRKTQYKTKLFEQHETRKWFMVLSITCMQFGTILIILRYKPKRHYATLVIS